MGYIYLLECTNEDTTFYKIGYTKNSNIKKRISNLQTGSKDTIKELYKFESLHGRNIESTLHNLYKHKNIKNEWFSLDIKDVTNFLNLCEKLESNFDNLKHNKFFNKNSSF